MSLKEFQATGGDLDELKEASKHARTALLTGNTLDIKISAAIINISAGYVYRSKVRMRIGRGGRGQVRAVPYSTSECSCVCHAARTCIRGWFTLGTIFLCPSAVHAVSRRQSCIPRKPVEGLGL